MKLLGLALASAALLAVGCGGGGDSGAGGATGSSGPGTSGQSTAGQGGPGSTSGGPTTSAGPGSSSSSSGGPQAVHVIVEPSDDADALLAAINGAKKSVHLTMYLLGDSRFVNALIAKHAAGLDVKVILNKSFPNGSTGNTSTESKLASAGVSVVWSNPAYTLTHEKCAIIDGDEAWIMTMNLEKSSPTNREYLIVDDDAADVAEAEAIFAADFASTAIQPMGSLLVAPVNARDKMLAALQTAKKRIDLEGEELSDTKIVNQLSAAAKAGVAVHIVLASGTPTPNQSTAETQLKTAGAKLVTLANPYVHAKAFVVDGVTAYVGSENFTTGSLQYNRELGLLITEPTTVGTVASTIDADFAAGKPL